MLCFWTQGYEATSVRGLAERMGITGASLYNAFGDKRSLYRRSLEHYLDQSVRDRVARLEKLAPYSAIRAFFEEIVERSTSDKRRKGCMLVNSALEMTPSDPELRKMVSKELAFIEAFFRRCVAEGQKDGTVTRTRPASELAKVLLSVLLGIRVLARMGTQTDGLEEPMKSALALLRA